MPPAVPWITKVCPVCDKPFTRDPSHAKGLYCSRKCSGIAQRIHIEFTCAQCGTPFFRRPSEIANGAGKYCSAACRREGVKGPRQKSIRIVVLCQQCGEPKEWYPSQIARGIGKHCSRACAGLARRKPKAPPAPYICACHRCTGLEGLLVPTLSGWKTTLTLEVGDKVFDERGQPCTVIAAGVVQTALPCFAITFDDGTTIIVDADWQWLTWDKPARKAAGPGRRVTNPGPQDRWQRLPYAFPSVITTTELSETVWYNTRERNHSIPLAAPLSYTEKALPIEPYTFGVWLGDGGKDSATISCAEQEILDQVAADGYPIVKHHTAPDKVPSYGIGSRPSRRDPKTGRMLPNESVHSYLKALKVMNNKHIPHMYLEGSLKQRFALFHGLMDTDGYIAEQGKCEIVSVIRHLADDILQLARGLGLKATLREDRARLNGKDCGPRYRIAFTPHVPVFRLPRKLERQHSDKTQTKRTTHRYIVAVSPTTAQPMRRITTDSPSSLYLCSPSLIQTYGGGQK